MSASRVAFFFGLLLLTAAIARLPGLYRDFLQGSIDLESALRCRFDLMSGGMFVLMASAVP